jgi:hypothetical protein
MKSLKLSLIVIGVLILFSQTVFACQPCRETLNFDESAKKADLIIIGQKVADGPSTGSQGFNGGPEWIDIKLLETLKGDTSEKKIRVKSWYGMCAYGIIINDENPHVIFLSKEDNQYFAVNGGCATRTYNIQGEKVDFKENDLSKNTQKITIDELVKKIGPGAVRKKIVENKPKNKYIFYIIPIIDFLLLSVLIGVLVILKKKSKI